MSVWSELVSDPVNAAITVGAAVAAVLLLWNTGARIIRAVRRLVHFVDGWEGYPARPGIPARPGVLEQLAELADRLDRVEHRTAQLTPNGGSHMVDKVERIAKRVDEHAAVGARLGDSLTRIEAQLSIIDAGAAIENPPPPPGGGGQ